MFLYLIAGLMVLSAILAAFDISVTEEVAVPVPIERARRPPRRARRIGRARTTSSPSRSSRSRTTRSRRQTFEIRSLLSVDGLRFVFSTFVANFAAFGVVAVTLVAMAGVGVAEQAGMMGALIRKIVKVAPPGGLAYILILVGVLSSVASDAGYLILIPLGAAAFLSVGRHPLAGHGGRVRRRRRDLRRQHPDHPDRQHDHRDLERGDRVWRAASRSTSPPTSTSPSCRRCCCPVSPPSSPPG